MLSNGHLDFPCPCVCTTGERSVPARTLQDLVLLTRYLLSSIIRIPRKVLHAHRELFDEMLDTNFCGNDFTARSAYPAVHQLFLSGLRQRIIGPYLIGDYLRDRIELRKAPRHD